MNAALLAGAKEKRTNSNVYPNLYFKILVPMCSLALNQILTLALI